MVQSIMQIMLFLMDNGFGSECTDQERLDYFSAGFCSGYKAGGVEEDWIDEAFCEYERKRQERTVGAKNTEQQVQPDNAEKDVPFGYYPNNEFEE